MTARLSPRVRAGKLSYYQRWQVQHRIEAEIMAEKGYVWSVGLQLFIPARKQVTR